MVQWSVWIALAVGVIAEAVDVSSDANYDVSSFNATWHDISVKNLSSIGGGDARCRDKNPQRT